MVESDRMAHEAEPSAQSRSGSASVSVVAIVELAIGLIAVVLAWRRLGAEGQIADSFWVWLAVALFCLPLAMLNFLGPRLRARRASVPPEAQRLPARLSTYDGTADVMWSILGLGIGFAGPAIPLIIYALRLSARGSELVLIPAGLAAVSGVAGGIMLLISGSHVYKLLVKGDAIVEMSAAELMPGQTARLFISYTPGRATPRAIAAHLVCRVTTRKRSPNRSKGSSGYVYTREVVYEQIVGAEQPFDAGRVGPWEQLVTIEIPGGAAFSTAPDTYPTVDWSIEIVSSVPLLPDFRLTFPFKVIGDGTAEAEDDIPDDDFSDDED